MITEHSRAGFVFGVVSNSASLVYLTAVVTLAIGTGVNAV
jgi:hypothetical protein